MTQETVRQGTVRDLRIAAIRLVLTAALHEGDFVVPPHDVSPVRLVVFLKLSIELQVLSDPHHDVVWGDARVSLVATLIPFALAEVEGAHSKGNVDDGTLLGSLVLDFDARKLGIFVPRHEQNAALGQLLQQVAWSKAILAC